MERERPPDCCPNCGRSMDDHQWFGADGRELPVPLCLAVGEITKRPH